jgi:YebC/PmpR family DNA-binding regulatory protein
MSGHSKWSQIKRQKAANDTKRGQAYTKLGKEIVVAVQQGGPDPDGNFRLEQALGKARAANMPKDTIERAIQRGLGSAGNSATRLEELTYEGYGPSGAGLLIEVVTDNRNRSVAGVRNTLSKMGGSLAESGSVAWQFASRGMIKVSAGADAEEIELAAIDLGAVDVEHLDDSVHVYTSPSDLDRVRRDLEAQGHAIEEAELTMVPATPLTVDDQEAERVVRMVEHLEELDDVRRVHSTLDLSEALLAKLAS